MTANLASAMTISRTPQPAFANIDEVIKIIRGSKDTLTASSQLQEAFDLSERQAKAILDMRLARLTGLEIEKLEEELTEVRALIAELRRILDSEVVRMGILKEELAETLPALAKRLGVGVK